MTIALILARGGSKSIPKKNIINVAGKPLIFYMIDALSESDVANEIFVSTDDASIADIIKERRPQVKIFNRSKANADDNSSSESAILEFLNAHSFDNERHIIFAQATSPLTTASDIVKAYNMVQEANVDSILSVVRQKRFIWSKDGKAENYNISQRPRRQDFEGYLVENGAFYISTVERMIRYQNRLSGNIGLYEMPEDTYFELDEKSDIPIIEALLEARKLN